uniref:C2H2-type domain-containing protein n=1 Tax=Oncorhynchus tshawytscha TaxID=74940 RepID=A0AAZ3NWN7_ONCTS
MSCFFQPFYNNVYYPYQPETQGTHSSAGIPSPLNSPLSQPSSSSRCPPAPPPPAMSASTSTTIPPFKFRPRRESVDWRRISAVDVDLVASELDFQTLQEHITGVTFCNVEGERCVRCQSPVDPALLKLFRLAQLTVEYLLHSQEYLTLSLGAAEERLQSQAREHQQLLAQQQKQADQAKVLKTELKQRKKIIALNQQAMINMTNCHKCQHCDKAFMNSSFLQNHMQRRHADEYDKLRTGNQREVKSIADEEEISRLKGQLSYTTSELESQRQALLAKASQEREQQSMHQDLMRKLERWKEEEHRKIEEMRDGFQREIEMLHNRNALLQQVSPFGKALTFMVLCPVQTDVLGIWFCKSGRFLTPPFSSDDKSTEEEESEEEKVSQPKPTQPKTTPHHKLTQSKPVQARSGQPRTTQAQPYKPQQPRSAAVNTTKMGVNVVESEGEWTEGSELEEIDQQQLQNYKDQNGNVQKTTNIVCLLKTVTHRFLYNLVKDLTKSLEKQLADRGPKKPLGGVSFLPERKDKDVVRELKYTNDDDEDDWDISSLDDLSVPAPVGKPTAPVRKSLDSDSTTSVWGTSTGKGQKTGLNEAGTGSDWSDDDI